jgi:hypothetical protein
MPETGASRFHAKKPVLLLRRKSMTEAWAIILAVIATWILTTLMSMLAAWRQERSCIGKLLSHLLSVQAQIKTLKNSSEGFKEGAEDWREYEIFRKRVSERHFMNATDIQRDINPLLEELSGARPLLSLEIRSLLELLHKAKSASFAASVEKCGSVRSNDFCP